MFSRSSSSRSRSRSSSSGGGAVCLTSVRQDQGNCSRVSGGKEVKTTKGPW